MIKELPNGINTMVGDKGNFLSSGQIQRIALARILYKDPEVLILDEFTSALDQDTEKSILENIKTYQKEKNKTIILISHKIGPLKYCNKIILLKDGKIIDQLNFEDYKKKIYIDRIINFIMSKISIIGLGYVGLPLAIAFSKKFEVVGYDINSKRVKDLINGKDVFNDLKVKNLKKNKKLNLTSNLKDIEDLDYYIVTVPTPVNKNNNPDLRSLISASKIVGKSIKKKSIVIFESTVFPSCTEEVCIPIIEKYSGYKLNQDFYCGYSPERINVGDNEHTLEKITKVVSGSNKKTTDKIYNLYKNIIRTKVFKASSIKVAEAAKVIENTQRDLNISLLNELSIIFDRLDIDTNDVIEAAATKWNFIKYKPGLVGGHCVGVDPFYLTYKAKKVDTHQK